MRLLYVLQLPQATFGRRIMLYSVVSYNTKAHKCANVHFSFRSDANGR